MTAFIVVPKQHRSGRAWEVIDTVAAADPSDSIQNEARVGMYDHPNQALAICAVLNGAEPVYRAELKRTTEPF